MVCFLKSCLHVSNRQDMPEEASVLSLMCEVWNQAHLQTQNKLISKMTTDFQISESVTWEEMKMKLEEKQKSQKTPSKFSTRSGEAAYLAVLSTMIQVVCVSPLDEEETAKVKLHAKTENANLNEQLTIQEGTNLKIPLSLVDSFQSKVKILKYPSGYDQKTREMISESFTVFNLNDVHPAFYTLGQHLVHITKDEELMSFLEFVQQERFENLVQCIAHDEEIPDTGISASAAEAFLSEEEKEVLREWQEDIRQLHIPVSEFGLMEAQFMEKYGISES